MRGGTKAREEPESGDLEFGGWGLKAWNLYEVAESTLNLGMAGLLKGIPRLTREVDDHLASIV